MLLGCLIGFLGEFFLLLNINIYSIWRRPMELGIVGLPLSGKTTLFSTLTEQELTTSHTAGKLESHRGVVRVPDERLDQLTAVFKPQKQINATIEYIEVGGLEKDSTHGKGFDSQFLAILKNTDALCLVVRAFEDAYHPHPEGSIDPLRDVQIVESEFLLSDLTIVENRISRLVQQIQKSKSEEDLLEKSLMEKFKEALEREIPLRELNLSDEDRHRIRGYQFLSAKPLLIVINYGESDISQEDEIVHKFTEYQDKLNVAITGLCAKLEYEISQLDPTDKELFLQEMQIDEPVSNKFIRKSYELLGLLSFFTHNENECRAWNISKGTPIQKAAGIIHSDMERGFIRAEVIHFNDFIQQGSIAKCREKGVLHLEGKNYIVQDGDIVTIRFNV